MKKIFISLSFLALSTGAFAQTYTPGQNQMTTGGSQGGTSYYTPKPTYQDNSAASSNSSQDQQSPDTMQSLIAQEQQNLNIQVQHLQSMPGQVRQSELQTQQLLTERNENRLAPSPAYVPRPAPVYMAPPPASQAADNGTASTNTAPPATACITGFYNPKMYGWWNWKNSCSFTVDVSSQLRTASYPGENTVIPGDLESGSTGLTPDEVNSGGGYVYIACPDGYTSIDPATGQLWTRNSASFYCKRQ